MSIIRFSGNVVYLIGKDSLKMKVFSSCSGAPLLLTAIVIQLYGINKILTSKYVVRKIFSNPVALIVILLNIINTSTVILFIVSVNISFNLLLTMLMVCCIIQACIGIFTCIPCAHIFYLFRKRSLEQLDIIDPNYSLLSDEHRDNKKRTVIKRLSSFMDTFHINISNKTRIPYFIKALLIECLLIIMLVCMKIGGVIFIVKCLWNSKINYDEAFNYSFFLYGIENILGFHLLTYCINALYTKYKSSKNRK
ncbi:hypothetical protein A3Q56_03999 [Intoshia linei]|uniref:G-protein coupled receptors family 1 profile domain-containing protein n=1 Tax=Intoshia linei TaxID=1819745 RepID=A0A177B1W0_9BILA|nr:hypothetical protein A3Q56_03999 [Intoshia linei]